MKFNSLQKLEKQARKYLQDNPVVMPPGWQEKYDKLNQERQIALQGWQPYKTKCLSQQSSARMCICWTLPRYQELIIDKIRPLGQKIDVLYFEKRLLEKDKYEKHLNFLLKGRRAKQKFLQTT